MIKIYNTDQETNEYKEITEYKDGSWINMIDPTEKEIEEVCSKLQIQQDFIRYSLDNEEKARIDYEEDDDTVLFIMDVPVKEKEQDRESQGGSTPISTEPNFEPISQTTRS